MSTIALGRTWDEASAPEMVRLAGRFASAWRAAEGNRPDPIDFLPAAANECPGALLALLRTDLALRREADQPVDVEWYRARYPSLDDEAMVALIYEEYCLREEAGETPDPAEYEARFPEVAPRLREVIEIHGFVAGCSSTAPHPPEPAGGSAFPESDQTIAGFRLVEELGRGSFARVFLAQERRLADRPVIVKVTRLGTREPQTLARLQHTYIVPVHSYRTDPATGLHLLCMPYFGRLTLAHVLADPAVASARSGAELVAALDRLQPQPVADRLRSAARAALAGRSYPRAIAWWGARLAEALQHAHERGVLHRDLKPSNVLVTDDGLPMLLDFNLACDPGVRDPAARTERVGGTLAYMAPEHLEALIERAAGWTDHRADLYSLALILLEALGTPPMGRPTESPTGADAPFRLLEARRAGPPEPRADGRSVPAAFRAVLRRCLAPDPAGRYASAAELATDLQAVADASPLRFTHEPMASRLAGWVRRNRLRTAVGVPVLVALVGFAAAGFRREAMARRAFDRGAQALAAGDCATAAAEFTTAAAQAEGWLGLGGLGRAARTRRRLALEMDTFYRRVDPLRFHLLGFGGHPGSASRELAQALAPFGVLDHPAWWLRGELGQLDEPMRARLLEEVNELMFLWIAKVGMDRPDDPEMIPRAIELCERALHFAEPRGPWDVLRHWWLQRLGRREHPPVIPRDAPRATSARACFQWALLARLEHDRELMLTWLERARFLRPDNYWHQYALACNLERSGKVDAALQHYEAAVALRPEAPWAWFNRAHLYAFRLGAWELALRDLDRAVAAAGEAPEEGAPIRIQRGKVRWAVGDILGARADFEAAIAVDPAGPLARAARLDRARLLAEAGAARRARAEYDALVDADPSDWTARLARALLALRQGRAADAVADLTRLLSAGTDAGPGTRAEWLAARAMARLALGCSAAAHADADAALRLAPSPGRTRLRNRTALAAGRPIDDRFLDPDAIAGWPLGGPALVADLRAAIERLEPCAADPTAATTAAALRARAAMLSALNEHTAAMVEADRSVVREPSAASYTLRAAVRLRAGERAGARADVERGLAASRDDPLLPLLRGRLALEDGDPEAGLRWLDRALFHGAPGPAQSWRARALGALDRLEAAAAAWSSALATDPDDPEAFLGRARCLRRLGLWENALADLEQAAQRAADGSHLLARVTLEYLACLPARPNRLPRAVSLALRLLPG